MRNTKFLLKIAFVAVSLFMLVSGIFMVNQYNHRNDIYDKEIHKVSGIITEYSFSHSDTRLGLGTIKLDNDNGMLYCTLSSYSGIINWLEMDALGRQENTHAELDVYYEDDLAWIVGITMNGTRFLSPDDAIRLTYENDRDIIWMALFFFFGSILWLAFFVFLQFFWDKIPG